MDNVKLSIISALGMMVVACGAVVLWRRRSGLALVWFWIGAGLWTVAVILKIASALLTNQAVVLFMKDRLAHVWFVVCAGAFVGLTRPCLRWA